MNKSPLWKVLLLIAVVASGFLYALPNIYGEDAALLVSPDSGDAATPQELNRVEAALKRAGIEAYTSRFDEQGRVEIRLDHEDSQLPAADALKRTLGYDYIVAMTMIPRTPGWLLGLGGQPMALGLDLRGGVHFLMEVDVEYVLSSAAEQYARDLPSFLRNHEPPIRYTGRRQADGAVELDFGDIETRDAALRAIREEFRELSIEPTSDEALTLRAAMSEEEVNRLVDFSVKQNLTTLRNRVNQLGVAEPLVQRQGRDRILVQLPGVKDPTQAKSILDATATLEYRAVAEREDAQLADRTGVVPADTDLFYERGTGRPILLKSDVIATGSQIIDAAATIDQESGTPAVSVTLNGAGAKSMFGFTESNVGRLMAVLFKETDIRISRNAAGEEVRQRIETEEVISVATVRGVFGKRFQTTGLTSKEAHDLSLLLRSGALAAPIAIVEERTIGPSLGQDNIDQGMEAVLIGFALVVVLMVLYYRVFGLIANLALFMNLVLIIAALSLLQATLTLPGIAGIVLTVGMAVDANVLIFERIREELIDGSGAQQAIRSGYEKAFVTIADANITTLIAAIVLFVFGTGPIKGFAVTLSIGVLSSMFTAILGTRVLVNALYGGTRRDDLPV
ncbi:preprotein translocase subunit SecD [Oceanococcus atlanticus]|uniref:Protein translocase subunit SecD n=1 Tax=Oceanococcus atlanticus TaxID=1317117 RepID=A0A1Y1SFA1_9GAMM|nr:protein translocase subunit SecD [Oceanococcus atlanticus]ORE88342.1 preprotein translocase subunit SecD [Oceanococcus atlanticus]RZO85575.1 MAG: protein translocase subunit SecD [Oceanococcus sp.]